jgi:hypothetical protein
MLRQNQPDRRNTNAGWGFAMNGYRSRTGSMRAKRIDQIFRSSYRPERRDQDRESSSGRGIPEANRPRKQLESSAPLGFAASGIFLR